ncbi:hypothetical protein [Candidatus Hodgkinia cicadicola]|uniref:hypothetical protein n=1 Tax=Candidatus Hodgkinia cicadicola TaxID=573658 RepID=UPI001788AC08
MYWNTNNTKFNAIIALKEPTMRDYITIVNVAMIPEVTSCQIWLAAIKLMKQARWGRFQTPTKMYTDTGKLLWFKASTCLKLGNTITSLCFTVNNTQRSITNHNWYLLTAENTPTKTSTFIGLKGITSTRCNQTFQTSISPACKNRLDIQLKNTVPGPNQTFYARILGKTQQPCNIESMTINKGTSILGSESLTINYWSTCFLAAYLVSQIFKENKTSYDNPWIGLTNTLFWSKKLEKPSINTSNSCTSIVLTCNQYPERQRRLSEIQRICENELLTGTQTRLPWSIKPH